VRLRLRDVEDIDAEDRELLDANVRSAERAYRDAPDFETAARAPSGWREAVSQRLTAPERPDQFKVPMVITTAESSQVRETTVQMSPQAYWNGVPARFRNADRYVVERTIALQLQKTAPQVEVTVRRTDADVVVWKRR
jgi:hypothetical protein